MDPHLERNNGQIHLGELLNAAGLCESELPTLPRFCWPNNQSYLCWSSTLGRCKFPNFCFRRDGRHPGPNDIPDDFAEKVVRMLAKGIQAQTPTGGGGRLSRKEAKTRADEPNLTSADAKGNRNRGWETGTA
jgi:hypothetical protein